MQVALNILSVAHSTAAMNTELRSRVGAFPWPSAGPQKPDSREKQQHLSQLSLLVVCLLLYQTRITTIPNSHPHKKQTRENKSRKVWIKY